MKKINLKIDSEYFIPISLILLYFIAVTVRFSPIIYGVLGALGVIYFFPVRFFIFKKEYTASKEKVLYFILNFVYASVIGISIAANYLREDNKMMNIIALSLGIILIASMVIIFLRQRTYKNFFMSLLFCFFLCEIFL